LGITAGGRVVVATGGVVVGSEVTGMSNVGSGCGLPVSPPSNVGTTGSRRSVVGAGLGAALRLGGRVVDCGVGNSTVVVETPTAALM
jgi:hypothetical protein